MTQHKFAVIAMPFGLWRTLLSPPMNMEVGLQLLKIIDDQLRAQAFHAQCGYPRFKIRPSLKEPKTFELLSICTCGEALTTIDGITKEMLEPIGPLGAFTPDENPN